MAQNDLKILIQAQLNEQLSEKAIKDQLKNIQSKLNLDISINAKQVAEQVSRVTDEVKKHTKGITLIDSQTVNKDLSKVQTGLKNVANDAKKAKNETISFGSALSQALQKFPIWLLAGGITFLPIRGLQNIVEQIISIDTAMVSLGRVTDMTDQQLSEFLQNGIDLSTELSNKLTDLLVISEEFARMGFQDTELLNLSKTAQVLQNISDLDAKQSVDTITTAMLNFNIAAEDSLKIADQLNEVDNKFAISTLDLSNGLRKAASTSKTFGVSIEDLIGNIAAIGSTTRESGVRPLYQ